MGVKTELKKVRERALSIKRIEEGVENYVNDERDKELKEKASEFITKWLVPEYEKAIKANPERNKFLIKIIDAGSDQYIVEYWYDDFLEEEEEKKLEYPLIVIWKATEIASEYDIEGYRTSREISAIYGYDDVSVCNFELRLD